MIGKTVSHYKIIEEIGAGGMGVVYKAEDTKLKRIVALKFLPPELTRDPEAKKRFIREAQAASALEHPNICNIHEIDETKPAPGEPVGQLFIVMACYEGETLKLKIEKGKLKIEEAVDYTIQIAQGLEKAHEQGISHRDIKPANIIITTDGLVKILDFGLAKLAGQAQFTKDTSTLGTVAYMSPEQVSGKEVDQRTDIWSLGGVLYEMLTGELPFKGDYEQAVIYAILNEEPQPLSADKKMFSAELERILSRALNKNPQERYINAAELLQELSSIRENIRNNKSEYKSTKSKSTKVKPIYIISAIILFFFILIAGFLFFPTSEPEESIKSLAVLPFTNIKSDPNTDYLGDALAAEIIRDLTYLRNITVLPFNTVRKIEKKEMLRADYILTGNYLKEKNIISLNIELIDNNTNNLIWQEPVEQAFENTFQLQDIVSEKVINGLKIQFSQEERNRMEIDVLRNPRAYEYFLRGIAQPATIDGIRRAIDLLQHSIQIDSSYAPAFNELGFRIHRLTSYKLHDVDRIWEAERAYQRALSLNAELLGALGNLSILCIENGRLEEAEKLAEQMLRINPNNAIVHFVFGYMYRYAGLMEEAKKEMEKAVMLDPNDVRFRSLGITYCYLEEYDKAFEAFEIDKGSLYALTYQGWTFLRQGKIEMAGKYFDRATAMEPDAQLGLWSSALKAYVEGSNEEGLSILRRLEQTNPPDADNWYLMGVSYALLGDEVSCIRVLKKAVERGFYNYPLLAADKFLDTVRDDPEFQKVLVLAKEKHEAFKQKYFTEE